MKLVIGLVAVLTASVSLATSPKYGPWINKTVGNPKTDKNWVMCLVTPTSFEVVHYVNGEKKEATIETLSLDAKKLEQQITLASKAPVRKALHIVEQVPNVSIQAGVFPTLQPYVLLHDASQLTYRDSKEASALVELANRVCGRLKPHGSPREN